jgi:hypothetical protein
VPERTAQRIAPAALHQGYLMASSVAEEDAPSLYALGISRT